MSQRFYQLGGLKDHSLKNTYLSSLLEELQDEMWRILNTVNKEVTSLSLGEIYQISMTALEKICSQRKMFESLMNHQKKYDKMCKKDYLKIKCSGDTYTCPSKKKQLKKTEKRFFKKGRKKKKTKFFKKKPFRGKRRNQKCFICGKPGHYSKECPQKSAKTTKLIESLIIQEDANIESLYDEQECPDEEKVFTLTV
ncbi:hypothetical protein Fmac_001503 [Flemingia macrophylla]|uniref:CCHC-type domain-containing protein n=1 Tax=Flemingia macrophylla TaxID=520843 RepID=A0ABD1NH98_9FABA